MFKTEADDLKEGDRIRLIEEDYYSPFKVGIEFTVTSIDTVERTITLKRQKGITACISFLEFNIYFEKIKPNKWTKWSRLSKDIIPSPFKSLYSDEEILYRYNGRKIEIKKGNIKVKACCHKEDEFILEKGIEIALTKLYIEEKTIQKNRLELLIRKNKMELEIEINKIDLDLSLFKKRLELEKYKYKKRYYKDDSINGRVHKLGTLYVGDMKIKRPTRSTRPFRIDSTQIGNSTMCNIFNYDTNSGNIEIRDTDNYEEYQIQWVEVNDNGKKLLVCDRNMLVGVSWDDLNKQGLIEGKIITIDNNKYKIKLLTGGSNYRNNNDSYFGGYHEDNEWDRIICNEGYFKNLPTPQSYDLDSSLRTTDYYSEHDKLWNWVGIYSWCKEVYLEDSIYRAIRGFNSARYYDYDRRNFRYSYIGWRPVLEVIE